MNGTVQLMGEGRIIPGPYNQQARHAWAAKLLEAQAYIRVQGPEEMRGLTLITVEELEEIRRIWVIDKHEIEDALPGIYRKSTGDAYPGRALDDSTVLGQGELAELEVLCGHDRLHYELTRELLSITQQQRATSRRASLYAQIEQAFKRHFYDDADDAHRRAEWMSGLRRKPEDERPKGPDLDVEAVTGPILPGLDF